MITPVTFYHTVIDQKTKALFLFKQCLVKWHVQWPLQWPNFFNRCLCEKELPIRFGKFHRADMACFTALSAGGKAPLFTA